ncbi:hypothetical protein D9623_29055 (plasmid) [Azospirillum brasilense]|uniref:Uncharacterized protein n=1 Tax=Azospirillum brasilense TaxID=192 RepID=A0A4D8QMW4_AZOBR|nr:hypothetical protein D3868_24795 [Azospirillum brasilense]QEL92870.1 hypothetical protein D9621_22020 [Azospirillum brasilense]QEL94079.1 hypothetical protein D9621_28585 [Azospirillum brasilense]QEL99185.1 hypothetical protein D9623_22290 [Azospirillum brasilense]QEM00431.1 hypothetical protein D9623_29055 [Azospirillum brasilense]
MHGVGHIPILRMRIIRIYMYADTAHGPGRTPVVIPAPTRTDGGALFPNMSTSSALADGQWRLVFPWTFYPCPPGSGRPAAVPTRISPSPRAAAS